MRQLPMFTIRGEAGREVGCDYGRQCRDLIAGVLGNYKKFFDDPAAVLSWEEAKEIAKAFIPAIEAQAPLLLEELKGIAEGSGADFFDLLTLNARSEAMTLVPEKTQQNRDGCTTAMILPEASRDGHTLLAQNWDTYSWQGDGAIILEILREDGPDLMIVTEAGQLARYGMNQAGICLGVNSLHRTQNEKVFGMPSVFLRRRILERDRYVDATNEIFAVPSMLPMYYVVGYAGGDAMGFEVLRDGALVLYPEGGRIVHSNHILHPHHGYQVESLGGTLYRNRRIEKHLAPLMGEIDREVLVAAMSDHFGYPFAVCRHGDVRKKERDRISTLACIVMDLTERRLWACKDTPCANPMVEFHWTRTEKLREWDNPTTWQ